MITPVAFLRIGMFSDMRLETLGPRSTRMSERFQTQRTQIGKGVVYGPTLEFGEGETLSLTPTVNVLGSVNLHLLFDAVRV